MQGIVEEEIGYLTIQQAADLLGIHRTAVYQAIREGRLKTVRVMGKQALRRADVDAYQPRNYRDRQEKTVSA